MTSPLTFFKCQPVVCKLWDRSLLNDVNEVAVVCVQPDFNLLVRIEHLA